MKHVLQYFQWTDSINHEVLVFDDKTNTITRIVTDKIKVIKK